MQVRLIAITEPMITIDENSILSPTAEDLIVYVARVSNPSNQSNLGTGAKLLRYCIKNKHWSIFETVSMTVEIQTSRAIAAQILRHRSFTFQEFSQRYAVATEFEKIELRTQDTKNRQGSGDVCMDPILYATANDAFRTAKEAYDILIRSGISKETARMVLPMCTQTTLYMTGSVRSWIHYFDQRCSSHAQKEHRLVAEEIRNIFAAKFPVITEALDETKTDI